MSGFYLVADPQTGNVIRRMHDLPRIYEHLGMMSVPVSKRVWKSYRVGQELLASDIEDAESRNLWTLRRFKVRREQARTRRMDTAFDGCD